MNGPPELPVDVPPAIPRRPKFRWWVPVVIIIAGILLIASSTPVYLKALSAAKREATIVFARLIEQSVNSYYTDNGVLPLPPPTGPTKGDTLFITDTPAGLVPINALAGHLSAISPRGIRYLNPKEARGKRDGATYHPSRSWIIGLHDPWGNPYQVVLDTDYDEIIVVPLKTPVLLKGKRAAVYSAGPDGILETNDDIKSWR